MKTKLTGIFLDTGKIEEIKRYFRIRHVSVGFDQ